MHNKQEERMRASVTDNTGRVIVCYGASAAYKGDGQFNEEKGDISLNCFGELAIVPVGYNGIQMQTNKRAYNDHSTKVEDEFRACRKINRGNTSFHYQIS